MALLIAGLIIFLGSHSVRIFAEGFRNRQIEQLGPMKWKGLYTLISIAGFALLVVGYSEARMTPVELWQAPLWGRHLALLLNLFAFILLVAAYIPGNGIKAKIGHPMVVAVKIWAFAHLLANGTLADTILFGSFLVWAVLDFRTARKRDRAAAVVRAPGKMVNTLLTAVIGVAVWAAFVFKLHALLIGVSPLGM